MKKPLFKTLITFIIILTTKLTSAQVDTIYESNNLYYSIGTLKDSSKVGTWYTYSATTYKKVMTREYNMSATYPQTIRVVIYGKQVFGINTYNLYLESDTSQGYKVGYNYYFNEDSVMLSKSFYNKNGQIDGKSYFYYTNGPVQEIKKYKNGQLNGKIKKYYSNGNKWLTGWYKNSINIGKWKTYYEDGTLKSEGRYTGTLQKDTISLDSAAKLLKSGVTFVNRNTATYHKNGKWKYYDKNGKLTKVEYYKNSGTPYRKEEY